MYFLTTLFSSAWRFWQRRALALGPDAIKTAEGPRITPDQAQVQRPARQLAEFGRARRRLLGAEHGVGAVHGEDAGDLLEAGEDAVGEPPAVTAGDLAVAPFVDGPGVLPGRQCLAEDVPAFDDPEAVPGEERGPVAHQLSTGAVQHRPPSPQRSQRPFPRG